MLIPVRKATSAEKEILESEIKCNKNPIEQIPHSELLCLNA